MASRISERSLGGIAAVMVTTSAGVAIGRSGGAFDPPAFDPTGGPGDEVVGDGDVADRPE